MLFFEHNIKTSTGKIQINLILESVEQLLRNISLGKTNR